MEEAEKSFLEALVDTKWDLFCTLRLNEMYDNKMLTESQVSNLLKALNTMNKILEERMTPELQELITARKPRVM